MADSERDRALRLVASAREIAPLPYTEAASLIVLADALAASEAAREQAERKVEWLRGMLDDALALIDKTTYRVPGWTGPDVWWKGEADALHASAALRADG